MACYPETWTLWKEDIKILEAFEMWILRKINKLELLELDHLSCEKYVNSFSHRK